jgi:hypothetical protein
MSRCIDVGLVAALLLPAAAAAADAATHCEASPAGRERLDVACSLHASKPTQRYRFTAHFTGSHDDTRLSMTVTLDGAPLACAPGSKTSLEGEDGDVSLHCIVPPLARAAGNATELRVRLTWWHALYSHFDLKTD